jgi:hypothetical protein
MARHPDTLLFAAVQRARKLRRARTNFGPKQLSSHRSISRQDARSAKKAKGAGRADYDVTEIGRENCQSRLGGGGGKAGAAGYVGRWPIYRHQWADLRPRARLPRPGTTDRCVPMKFFLCADRSKFTLLVPSSIKRRPVSCRSADHIAAAVDASWVCFDLGISKSAAEAAH